MATRTKKAKVINDNKLIYVLSVAVVLFLVFLVVRKSMNVEDKYATLPVKVVQNTYPAVQGTGDLDKAAKELDGFDFNSIDKELNNLYSDSSGL